MDSEEVRRIARLAKLRLAAEDADAFSRQLTAIFRSFEHLETLDTQDLDPAVHAVDLQGPLRQDEPSASVGREDLQKNTPHQEDGFFAVPPILDDA